MTFSFDFKQAPAHLIRRAHQLATSLFMQETAEFDVTPVQFAVLNALMETPGADQVTLAARVALDAATSGSVISRLEAKGWIRRKPDSTDKRRKLLWVTPAGVRAVQQMLVHVHRVQDQVLSTLNAKERVQFQSLLNKLVAGHEGAHD